MSTKLTNARVAAILAILLNGERYGLEIRDEYETRMSDAIPLGSLYVTLDRMEDAGLLTSRFAAESDKNGNRRRYFNISAQGRQTLNEFEFTARAILGVIQRA